MSFTFWETFVSPKTYIKGNSGSHARTRSSFKILTGIWLLSMVVLINAYSGVLTSILTVPIFKPIAKTLKDVAESKELRVTCENSSYMSILFLVYPLNYFFIQRKCLMKQIVIECDKGIWENSWRPIAKGAISFSAKFHQCSRQRHQP